MKLFRLALCSLDIFFYVEHSTAVFIVEAMAKDVLKEKKLTNAQRAALLYAKIYQRPPSAKESKRAVAFINNFAQDRQASWQALAQALVASNEFLYLK